MALAPARGAGLQSLVMIHILAGEKKGMPLRVARSKSVRPTAANARQVLFDILAGEVEGARWLDLYAGSGAVGLEALSRGAGACVLVESAPKCLAVIRRNVAQLGYRDRCRLLGARVEKALKWLVDEGETFDLVFLDPPYGGADATRCLLALGGEKASALLRSGGSFVVAQLSSHAEVRSEYGALALVRERKLGDTRICFFRLGREMTAEGGSTNGAA